eukprot:TRINITY_DN75240_c0_g1_i1.p1 TRINITY_DN75240_c0_g1~~TRINITY_DN75240_c0_g1_i1.p1  ORF type:complete len:422 (+),score=59.44 TRINITY_DN75240_c0_g1_i1:77-1342(+)
MARVQIKNTFIEVSRRDSTFSADFTTAAHRRQTDPAGMSLLLAQDPMVSSTILAPAPVQAPPVTKVIMPTPTLIAETPATLSSTGLLQLPPSATARRTRLDTSGSVVSNAESQGRLRIDTAMTNRRFSFDVPMTPDSYWSRSRASSVSFQVGPTGATQSSLTVPATTTSTVLSPLQTPLQAPLHMAPQPAGPLTTTGMPPSPYPTQVWAPQPSYPSAMTYMQVGYPYGAVPQQQAVATAAVDFRPRLELGALLGAPTSPAPTIQQAPAMMAPTRHQVTAGDSEEITTLMLRNIPVKYNREMMLEDIDNRGFQGAYDFFYLPIDFQTGNTVGYAFINLIRAVDAQRFQDVYNGLQLSPDSAKICQVGVAKAQGKMKNVEQYRNSSVMAMEERFQPVTFENGVRVPFPPPTRVLKPVKPRVKQ